MSYKYLCIFCQQTKLSACEESLKSEEYISAFMSYPCHIQFDNMSTSGGFISDEVKLVITIHLLAGGDALNLAVIFDVFSSKSQHLCIRLQMI